MPDELTPATTPETPPPAEATTPVAPVVESQQPPPPAVSPFVAKLTERGFEGVTTEAEGQERLLAAYEQSKTIAEQVKQALSELNQSRQPEPQQTQAGGQGWWNPPAVDESLVARFRTADGWKEGTPAEVRQAAESLEAYRERFARELVANPEKALDGLFEKKVGEYFDKRYGQVTAEQQERQFFQQIQAEHGDWLYQKDPHTGRPSTRLTEEGERFNQLMGSLEGESDANGNLIVRHMPKSKAFEVALRIRNAEKHTAAAKQPTPAQAAEINLGKKQELLARDTGRNRTGSLPQPGVDPPKNRNLSFGQLAEQEFKTAGGRG